MKLLGVLAACVLVVFTGFQCDRAQTQIADKEIIGDRLPDIPFSDVVRVGNLYFFSGKVGSDPSTGKVVAGGIEAETKAAMELFGKQLKDLGMDYSNLVSSTVYLTDINDFAGMNKVYKSYFKAGPPARATVAVKELVMGAKIEIAFIGAKTN